MSEHLLLTVFMAGFFVGVGSLALTIIFMRSGARR